MSDSENPVRQEQKSAEKAAVPVENTEGKLKRSREGTENDSNGEAVSEKADEEVAPKKAKTANGVEAAKKVEKGSKEVPVKHPGTSEKDTGDKPKHVFGSTTSFSAGFAAGKRSTISTIDSGGSNKEKSTTKPSAFGSGLSFGGGFTMLKKSDEQASKATEKDETSGDLKEHEQTPSSESKKEQSTETESGLSSSESSVFKLQKQEVKSGEESEEVVYQVNAKLYQLSDLKHGWKERGVGFIRVNKNKSTGKARLVMRSRGILKVILNLPLVKGFKIQRGFPGSLQGEKFIRITAVDDNKAPLQYAVKTGKIETVQELYDNIVKLVAE
ncbi:hypothetical protein HG536_0C05020 [Torulaspora globosa]|uniref:RanBD1 domain-containing protein n=1 Tax=Torulaspora globosa TaxID=48254 RepID=A0A7G3ZFP7_9SACH|nr:uncharacterized protein HG536_0C05020 [Torulaspora globosa]QLL32333.1 hypothetical protein HG536_0C05020 [Torulaspora globosa]